MLQEIKKRLQDAGVSGSEHKARLLLAHVLGVSYESVFAGRAWTLSEAQRLGLESLVTDACRGMPWSRLFGEREFWSLPFCLSPDTLDPRPETETLITAALQTFPDKGGAYRFLDLGTGSGCLLLSLLREYPNATGVGVDISPGALKMAAYNAEQLGVAARVLFVESRWTQNVEGEYDLVLSNPPYISFREYATLEPVVRDYDPERALVAGEDGLLCYRAIAEEVAKKTDAYPKIILELGYGQRREVEVIFAGAGYEALGCLEDLAGIPRALILEAKKL